MCGSASRDKMQNVNSLACLEIIGIAGALAALSLLLTCLASDLSRNSPALGLEPEDS